MDGTLHHYATVVLNAKGQAVRGFDYRERDDAEGMRRQLESEGYRAEVWPRNAYGERLAA